MQPASSYIPRKRNTLVGRHMTAIPVLFHMELESQTVEFQSIGPGLRVRGEGDYHDMLAQSRAPKFHLQTDIACMLS